MKFLIFLAASAQLYSLTTAILALKEGILNGASKTIAASGLLSLVTFIAIMAMELGVYGPRLQHGLGQILQIATGMMFARFHIVTLNLKKEALANKGFVNEA